MFGRHPRIRLAMVSESKGWEECYNFIKEALPKYFGTALNLSSMEDDKNTFTHSLTKATTSQITFTSVQKKLKSSSKCLTSASLCEGLFFYFYIESPLS